MKRRILAAIVGVATLAVLGFGIPLAWTIRRIERDDAFSMLQREAARAAVEVPGVGAGDSIELPGATEAHVTVGVYGADGARVAGNGPDRADKATAAALQGRLAQYSDAQAVAVGWPLTSNEQTFGAIRAALPDSIFEHRVHVVWVLMGLLGAAVIGGTALVAWRQAARLARPVEDLATAVARLGEGDFVIEVPASGVDEVDRAGETLTATAERLRQLMTRERTFSADVSHQLLTPLTGLRLTLENAATGTAESSLAVDEALASVDRLESIVTDLLELARPERPTADPIHLGPILSDVGQEWNGRLAVLGRRLRVDIDLDLPPVPISESAVRQMLEVLLANASDHGSGTVTVRAAPTPGGLVVEVSDEGAGITGDAERVFARGAGSGHGIGLALARSLAEAEGARLTLAAPGPNPRFRLLVPVGSELTRAGR